MMLVGGVLLSAVAAVGAWGSEFDSHWHDGRAELSGYRLRVSRYGQERTGRCVLIYVTEPFSESKRVKVDDHTRNPEDTFDALKLNLVRDFQTGIYDYNTMVSVFARSDDFTPAKISFTSAEWCGHVYEELIFGADKIRGHYYSYFEGESGPRDMNLVPNGIAEDNLFILLRGLRGPFLDPGAKKTVQLLPSVYFSRLSHQAPRWVETTIERRRTPETISVPAGEFTTTVYTIETAGGREGTFHIEGQYPHRIVRWSMPPDIEAELTGSERLKYWSLNKVGDESVLEKLGF